MAKIMLVEDDTNLSEIYRARLEAEGYQIVSARDGEEALALAVKEKPDLIICDVMMPKISGFEMLDILRGTQGIQNTRVIMMSALSQAEDKARASALGADRYLVKSQVTLEDVIKTVTEVLANNAARPTAGTPAPAATPPGTPASATTPASTASSPAASASTAGSSPPVNPVSVQTTTDEQSTIDQQINNFIKSTTPGASTGTKTSPPTAAPAATAATPAPQPTAAPVAAPATTPIVIPVSEPPDHVNISGKKVIQPLNDLHTQPDLNKLAAREEEKEIEQAKTQPVIGGNTQPPTSGSTPNPGTSPSPAEPTNPSNGSTPAGSKSIPL